VDLEGHVVGEQAVAGIGLANLPEDLAVEVNGSETAQMRKGVATDARDVLADEDVETAVSIQVA